MGCSIACEEKSGIDGGKDIIQGISHFKRKLDLFKVKDKPLKSST